MNRPPADNSNDFNNLIGIIKAASFAAVLPVNFLGVRNTFGAIRLHFRKGCHIIFLAK